MATKIKLKNVRLSFPSVFKKAEFNGEETKYEATFLMNKETQADLIAQVDAAIQATGEAQWKGKIPKGVKLCLQDGDDKEYDGYAGHMSLKAANNKRPTVLNRDKTPLTEEDEVLYAGCYVVAVVDFWAQDNSWGKRINCNLLGIQFLKDGESFETGTTASEDDFDDVDDEDDDI